MITRFCPFARPLAVAVAWCFWGRRRRRQPASCGSALPPSSIPAPPEYLASSTADTAPRGRCMRAILPFHSTTNLLLPSSEKGNLLFLVLGLASIYLVSGSCALRRSNGGGIFVVGVELYRFRSVCSRLGRLIRKVGAFIGFSLLEHLCL